MQKKKILNFRLMPTMMLVGIVGILSISLFNFYIALVVGLVFVVANIVVASVPRLRKYTIRAIVLLITFVLYASVGGVVMLKATRYIPTIESAVVSGIVNSESDLNGILQSDEKTVRYNLVLTDGGYLKDNCREDIDGKISGYLYVDINTKIKVGDIIILNADIVPNKINLTKSISVYDYTGGVRYTLENAKFNDIIENKPSFKENIKITCKNTMAKYTGGGMMYSMVFGDKAEMDSMFISSSQKTGIAHIFVVSGLHLGLIAGIIGAITKKLKINKIIDFVIVIILCGIYAYLVGLGLSVIRAYLMLIVYKLGKLLGLRYCGITSLSISVLIILLINPLSLFSVSFQLSVMAIVGILFFQKPMQSMIKTKWKFFNKFTAMNLSVNIAVLPITLHYFGSVSLIFLIANLLVVPIITIMYPIIFVVVISASFTPYIAYGMRLIGIIMELIEKAINGIANVPFLSIKLSLNIYLVIGYIAVLTLISTYSMLKRNSKRIIATTLSTIILAIAVVSSLGRIDGSIKIQPIIANTNYDIVIVDVQDSHYLVVNGNLDLYKVYTCRSKMREIGIDKIDGIVKTRIETNELDILYEYKNMLNIQKAILYEANEVVTDMFENKVKYNEQIGEWEIKVKSNQIIQITNNESKIVFANNLNGEILALPKQIDILYFVGNMGAVQPSELKYLVSDEAVINNISQSVPSHFTFVLKNDKIKVV